MTTILPIGVPADVDAPEPEPEPRLRAFTILLIEGERLDDTKHQVRSDYVEEQWLPYLGPHAILLARRIALTLSTGKHKANVKVGDWEREMQFQTGELLKACDVLVDWGFARWSDREPMLSLSRYWSSVPPCIQTPKHRHALIDLMLAT